jgi:hypothetical protein
MPGSTDLTSPSGPPVTVDVLIKFASCELTELNGRDKAASMVRLFISRKDEKKLLMQTVKTSDNFGNT